MTVLSINWGTAHKILKILIDDNRLRQALIMLAKDIDIVEELRTEQTGAALLVTLLSRAIKESVERVTVLLIRKAIKEVASQAAVPLMNRFREDLRIREHEGPLLVEVCGPDALPALLDALRDESSSVRQSAREGLASFGPNAVTPLINRFPSSEPSARESILQVLTRIGPSLEALPVLLDGIRDESVSVRQAAEEGLSSLGHSAMDSLLDVFNTVSSPARESIIRVFSRIGPARVAGVVLEAAKSGAASEKRTAIEALGSFASAEAYELVLQATNSEDPNLRFSAARALSQWRGASVLRTLEALTKDENEWVTECAIQGLEHLALSHPEERAEVIKLLLNIFVKQDSPFSDWALDALIRIETPSLGFGRVGIRKANSYVPTGG